MDRTERINRIELIGDDEAAILRRIPGARRVAMLDQLFEFGRDLMLARLREVHPDWSDQEQRREVARRIASAAH